MIITLKILISCVLLLSIFIYIKKNGKDLFTITSFLLLSIAVIFYFPIILNLYDWCNDFDFLLIILLGFLGMLFAVIIYEYALKNRSFRTTVSLGNAKHNSNPAQFVLNENKKLLSFLTVVVLAYYMANIIIVFNYYSWNISAALLRDRIEFYSSSVTGLEGYEDLVRPLALILASYYWHKKRKMGTVLWFAVLLFKLFVLHGRFEVILHVLLAVLFYNSYVKRIRLSTCVILLAAALAFLSIANYARTGLFAGGVTDYSALLPSNVFNQLFRASSGPTEVFYLVFTRNIPCEWFTQYIIYLPISFIPSALWPEKPVVSYFWRLTKAIYGVYPFANNSRLPVRTSTLWGEAYHEGGILNVFLVTIVFILIIDLAIKFTKKFNYTDLIVFSLMISVPMKVRGGLNSAVIDFVVGIVLLVALYVLGIYKRRTVAQKEASPPITSSTGETI